jgi:hypothetical protein
MSSDQEHDYRLDEEDEDDGNLMDGYISDDIEESNENSALKVTKNLLKLYTIGQWIETPWTSTVKYFMLILI